MRGHTALVRSVALATSLSLFVAGVPALAQHAQPTPVPTVQPTPLPPLPGGTASAPAASPPAQPPPPGAGGDSVFLKDGGMLRGTIVELVPNDHVSLQLATGQTAIVMWERIARIDRGGGGGAAPAYAPGAPPPFLQPGPPQGGAVLVHVESDDPVILEQRGGGADWSPACRAPCDKQLSLESDYRISGDGVRATRGFRLEGRPGERVVIHVSTRSSGARNAGLALMITGAAIFLTGLVLLVDWDVKQSNENTAALLDGRSPNDVATGERNGGLLVTLAGAVLAAVGIPILVHNSRSHQTQTVGSVPRAVPGEMALQQPVWHRANLALPRPPTPMVVPIWSVSF